MLPATLLLFSHVQLFKPFLQVLLFLRSLLQNTVALQKKGKKSHGQRNFSSCLKPSSVSLYFISTFFSFFAAFFSWDILYIAFFFLLRAFLGVTVQMTTFFPIFLSFLATFLDKNQLLKMAGKFEFFSIS